jgi:ABC-type nitrate/sulfonate/bicarbonate transport system ATPase subunit
MGAAEAEGAPEPAGIAVRGLRHAFGRTEVLAGIDLDVAPGETLALVGASGCGKSTMLELIAGLEPVQSGTIAIAGNTSPATRMASSTWMPQSDMLLPWQRAADNAAVALRMSGHGRASSRKLATAMLDHLGLAGFAGSYPNELSGGMRQRVAFARTLLAGTPVLLLDEPFAALDAITRAELQTWLVATLAGEARTTILVTHDVEEALFVADRIVLLTPRPATVRETIESPRPPAGASRAEAIGRADFVTARTAALDALGAAR